MFSMTVSCAIICGAAALIGGFIDAISGGGGLLSIPALLLTGVPPHIALGTNKFGASCGTLVALFNFARHGLVAWRPVAYGAIFSIGGSWLGTWFAMRVDSEVLGKIMVVLLPFAMAATLVKPKQLTDCPCSLTGPRFWIWLPVVCLAVGIYDGFFGPGTGTFMILGLYLGLRMNLIQSSGTAKAFNLATNISAAVSFVIHDVVYWPLAILMGVCFVCGNWLGSVLAIKVGAGLVRKFLIVSMLLLLGTLLWQFFLAPGD